uniref:Uncharacterized protein n=1 Tax=Psilocybe cubensis TaxID=181762 RepID=A0A8H8CP16_PSICU
MPAKNTPTPGSKVSGSQTKATPPPSAKKQTTPSVPVKAAAPEAKVSAAKPTKAPKKAT